MVGACFVIATACFAPNLYAAMDAVPPPDGDPPPPASDPTTIEDIETCLNEAVEAGTVEGTGRHFFWQFINLWRINRALEQARLAEDELKFDEAYGWLAYAYLRCDGPRKPLSDWITGPGVVDVKNKILDVMSQIEPLL
jgi:hypothetical protein